MATTPGWTPPEKTRPITPEIYALLRTYIEAGTAATRQYIDNKKAGCNNLGDIFEGDQQQTCRPFKTKPDLADMALIWYEFVPASLLDFTGATNLARGVMGYDADHVFEPWELPGWPTWVDRQQLLDALDAVTPAEVRAQIPLEGPPDSKGELVELPNAQSGGLEWWTIALGAAGVLAFLGRRTLVGLALSAMPKGALSAVARFLFRALVLAGVITAITWLGKKAVENATSALPWLVGGAAVIGLGTIIYLSTRGSSRAA